MGDRVKADPLLLQFGPLIYVAWSDGVLTGDEHARIEARLASMPGNGKAVTQLVRRWLNARKPPTPSDLNQLGRLIRSVGTDQLGPEPQALRLVEETLGIDASAALQTILGRKGERFQVKSLPVSAQQLQAFLAGDRAPVRARLFELLSAPQAQLEASAPVEEYRSRVYEACQWLAENGIGLLAFPTEQGGAGSIESSVFAFETIAFHDLSLLVKFGVHFGLFGGSVYQLGTKQHHDRYLKSIGTLALPGCFAMTETGHGSNVRDVETTATFDVATGEFVINTPVPRARKDYIGNAALHARMATVFAQLEVNGEVHGVHAFLVRIRDDQGQPWPGVRIEDCGLKAGLNGVDNGRLYFDHVRIPRDQLLNRFADVSPEGVYSSPIPSASRRFFTMLGTLVAGRISIAAASCSVSQVALTIAARYVASRQQFGPDDEPEVPVLSYQAVQRRLIPRLARTYALDAALHALVTRFAKQDEKDQRDIEVLAASLKAYASRHGFDTVQECRELCGGAGYLFENRFSTLRDDVDIFTTFEGANVVLQQLTAKGLLTDYREQFGELRFWSIARFVTARASTVVAEKNPIATRRTAPEHLLDPEFHESALRFREQHLLGNIAQRLKARMDQGADGFEAVNSVQDHMVNLATAHAERVIYDALRARVHACPDPKLQALLIQIAAVYSLDALERDRGWFLESGYFEPVKSKAIRRQLLELCAELAPLAPGLVDGFGIPESFIRAPLLREIS